MSGETNLYLFFSLFFLSCFLFFFFIFCDTAAVYELYARIILSHLYRACFRDIVSILEPFYLANIRRVAERAYERGIGRTEYNEDPTRLRRK